MYHFLTKKKKIHKSTPSLLIDKFQHILALIAVVLVVIWVHRDAMGGGGLSWDKGSKLVFNWHPVMMTVAYAFMTLASLTFRMKCYASNRSILKLIHGVKWTIAAVCGAVGVTAVFLSHNDAVPPIANLYSLHSWIGVATILLYLYQFSSGTLFFGFSIQSSSQQRAMMMSFHRYLGPCIYIITGTTILLGIQEKEGFVGCSYQVTTPDYNPLVHYFDIPLACRISHGLGLVVLLMMTSTTFALYQPYHLDGQRSRIE
jgi:cytochrome b-561